MSMTSIERFANALARKPVDLNPVAVSPWGATVQRWVSEGHIKPDEDVAEHFGQDYRGGGRSSGRETAGRVAAGAIAKKILDRNGIHVTAYTKSVGSLVAKTIDFSQIEKNSVRCPDPAVAKKMEKMIEQPCNIKKQGYQEKEQQKGQPDVSCPGKGFGKMTWISPFHEPRCHERDCNQPEPENKPYP